MSSHVLGPALPVDGAGGEDADVTAMDPHPHAAEAAATSLPTAASSLVLRGHQLTVEETEARAASLEDVLQSIPEFANEENRSLNALLLVKQRQLAVASAGTAENEERLAVMQEHLRSVQLEVGGAQRVLEARKKEQAAEEHMWHLSQRTAARTLEDVAGLERALAQRHAEIDAVRTQIDAAEQRLAEEKAAGETDGATIEKWNAAAAARDEDEAAVDRYARVDDARTRDLRRDLEAATETLSARRAAAAALATDTRSKQVEADRMVADYRAAHAERAGLISQWQGVLQSIQTRDEEILAAANALAGVRAGVAARRQRINEREGLLNRLTAGNAAVERAADVAREATATARALQARLAAAVVDATTTVEGLGADVLAAVADLSRRKAESAALEAQIAEQQRACAAAEGALNEASARLKAATQEAATSSTALAEREAYLRAETKRAEKVERDNSVLADTLYKARSIVNSLTPDEATAAAEVKSSRVRVRLLKDQLKAAEDAAAVQAEHVYAAEYAVESIERKISAAAGASVTESEAIALRERSAILRQECDAAAATERALTAAVKAVHGQLQAALRKLAELEARISSTTSAVEEVSLQNRSREEALRRANTEREEALVEHDVLRLEVRKLRDVLSARSEEVYALENSAANMDAALSARKRELAGSAAVQRATAKLLEEERHRLALELAERTQRVQNLRARYELAATRTRARMGVLAADSGSPEGDLDPSSSDPSGGGGGAPLANHIVAIAARKTALQEEVRQLGAEVERGEAELEALCVTLEHVNERNAAFRTALARSDSDSEEVQVVSTLTAAVGDAATALYAARREATALRRGTRAEEEQEGAAALRVAALTSQVMGLQDSLARSKTEEHSAGAEARRATARASEARVRLSAAAAPTPAAAAGQDGPEGQEGAPGGGNAPSGAPSAEELHYAAAGVRETTSLALYALGQVAQQLPVLEQDVAEALQARGLSVPSRPPPRPRTADISSVVELITGPLRGGTGSPRAVTAQAPDGGARAASVSINSVGNGGGARRISVASSAGGSSPASTRTPGTPTVRGGALSTTGTSTSGSKHFAQFVVTPPAPATTTTPRAVVLKGSAGNGAGSPSLRSGRRVGSISSTGSAGSGTGGGGLGDGAGRGAGLGGLTGRAVRVPSAGSAAAPQPLQQSPAPAVGQKIK